MRARGVVERVLRSCRVRYAAGFGGCLERGRTSVQRLQMPANNALRIGRHPRRGWDRSGRRALSPAAPPLPAVPAEPPALPPRDPPIRFRKTVPDCWIELVITEGRNRQVRKMTAAIGHPTLRLVRAAVGDYALGDLAPGG